MIIATLRVVAALHMQTRGRAETELRRGAFEGWTNIWSWFILGLQQPWNREVTTSNSMPNATVMQREPTLGPASHTSLNKPIYWSTVIWRQDFQLHIREASRQLIDQINCHRISRSAQSMSAIVVITASASRRGKTLLVLHVTVRYLWTRSRGRSIRGKQDLDFQAHGQSWT